VQAETAGLCGTLDVPEDRSNPEWRSIGIRVAVVPAIAAPPEEDPFFVLAGGPGDAGTQFFAWLPSVFEDIHASRDIVLFDQRGTGASNAMTLPPVPDTTGLSEDAADAAISAWTTESLAAIDGDARFYTSSVAADDLDDIREALGYEQINLYGTSYGATLAQYYMRQHGDKVRTAVFDGATPVDVPVFERMAANSQAALDLLLQRCDSDPGCHEAFPDISDEWEILIDRFETPVTVVDPESGEEAVLSLTDLSDAIHAALLTEETAAQIPLAIHLAYQEKYLEAAQLLGRPTPGGETLLMSDMILCSEDWARFNPTEVTKSGADSYALTKNLADAQAREVMCRHMPQGVVPSGDGNPVDTESPVLWVVGDGDPQDPPANLENMQAQQPNSTIVVMPAQQHVVGHLGCMPSLIAQFVDQGNADGLDTSCGADGPGQPLTFRLE
ncbi:MAG TPA: alpha/beta fold hydrolase, partial [Acidimicrobiia bacterium]|nr:alpha/beta fold hydrolase [Acidimicrobiia bacterium]